MKLYLFCFIILTFSFIVVVLSATNERAIFMFSYLYLIGGLLIFLGIRGKRKEIERDEYLEELRPAVHMNDIDQLMRIINNEDAN